VDEGPPYIRIDTALTIDIDESGTGSFSDTYERTVYESRSVNKNAIRTSTDNSVIWTGTSDRYDEASGVRYDIAFTTETTVIDEQTRRQDGVIDSHHHGIDIGTRHISYTLTGKIISDSPWCEAIAGAITIDYQDGTTASTVTITKGIDDLSWRLIGDYSRGESRESREILADSIPTFYCDFGP
jgi:hypothetical protein